MSDGGEVGVEFGVADGRAIAVMDGPDSLEASCGDVLIELVVMSLLGLGEGVVGTMAFFMVLPGYRRERGASDLVLRWDGDRKSG